MKCRRPAAVLALAIACCTVPIFARTSEPIRDARSVEKLFRAAAQRESVQIEGLPLGRPELDAVELKPFTVWDERSRIVLRAADGSVTDVPLPRAQCFRGFLADDPESAIVIIVENGEIHGAALTSEKRFLISLGRPLPERGSPRAGGDPQLFLTEIDEDDAAVEPENQWLCAVDQIRPATAESVLPQEVRAGRKAVQGGQPTNAFYQLKIAIDVDSEFFIGLGGTSPAVGSYVNNLLAFASTILERDANTSLIGGMVNINGIDDGYVGADPLTALGEMGTQWHTNPMLAATPRSAAILLSGKPFNGGIAYKGSICSDDFSCGPSGAFCGSAFLAGRWGGSYGVIGSLASGVTTTVAQPTATVNDVPYGLPTSNDYWMLLAFTHELGHLIGAEHTSCYPLTTADQTSYGVPGQSFIDLCYNSESGCYAGPVSAPTAEKGTIMSYCHNILSGMYRESRYLYGEPGKPSEKMLGILKAGVDAATPVGTITMGSTLACSPGQTASVTPCAGCTYWWTLTGGTITSSAAGNAITFTPSGNVTATVTISNAKECAITVQKAATVSCQSCVAPAITTQPVSGTILYGSMSTLTVAASGTAPLSYQWYLGSSGQGSPFSGATNNSLVVQPTLFANYWVQVSNACGSANSSTAAVAVQPANNQEWFRAVDFNHDLESDVLTRNTTNGDIGVWLMTGTTITTGTVAGSPTLLWRVAGAGDFDGNGKSDILLQNNDDGTVSVWLMNGTTVSTAAVVGTPGRTWYALGAADLNGDGRDDIVTKNLANGDLGGWIIASGGTSISSGAVFATPGTSYDIPGAGDFNGDGRDDILVRNSVTGEIGIYLMDGLAYTGAQPVGTPGTNFRTAGVCDLDGNNRADIVMQNLTNGDVGAWLMDGFAQQSAGVFANPGVAWRPSNTADFNKDGKADLIVQNSSSGDIGQWRMNGLTLVSGSVIGTPGTTWVVVGSR